MAAIEAPVNSRKLNSVSLARTLIADAGRANAALVLDPLQFFRSRDDVSVLEDDARIFAYTQFNDSPLRGPRMEPGPGEVPLRRILDLPRRLPISVEWCAPVGSEEPARACQRRQLPPGQASVRGDRRCAHR